MCGLGGAPQLGGVAVGQDGRPAASVQFGHDELSGMAVGAVDSDGAVRGHRRSVCRPCWPRSWTLLPGIAEADPMLSTTRLLDHGGRGVADCTCRLATGRAE